MWSSLPFSLLSCSQSPTYTYISCLGELPRSLKCLLIPYSSLRELSLMKKIVTGRIAPAGTGVCFLQIIFNRNLNHQVDKCRDYGILPNCRNSFRFRFKVYSGIIPNSFTSWSAKPLIAVFASANSIPAAGISIYLPI